MNTASSSRVMVTCTLESNILLRLRSNYITVDNIIYAVTEQKSTETNIKNVKRCRDGMPKSMQTR